MVNALVNVFIVDFKITAIIMVKSIAPLLIAQYLHL